MKYLLPTLLFILVAFTSRAQIPVDFQFCTGTGELCVTPSDSSYELCLTLKPGFCDTKDYEIRWGDGNTDKVTLTAEKTVKHVYDLRYFAKDCSSGEVEYNLNIKNSTCSNDNKGYLLTFKKKPEARPVIDAACVGSSVSIVNGSCPTYNIDFLWEFSDGQTSTSTNPYLTFDDPDKTYKVKLTAKSKTCGTSTAETEFRLKKPPVPAFTVKGTTVLDKDTVICSSSGGILELDGTISREASGYYWEIDGGKFEFQNNTHANQGKVKVKLSDGQEYTITLNVNNQCGNRKISRTYKVVSLPPATLIPQDDVCEEIVYKIKNPVAGATYTLNGSPFDAAKEMPLKFAAAPYIVTATSKNACGTQTLSDTFTVSQPQPVRIIPFPKDTILCVSETAIPLVANLPGGEWSTAGIETQNGQKVFIPKTPGAFTITYTRGTGKCLMTQSVKVTVEGIQATADDKTICEGTAWVKLTGTPAAGQWTTTGCSNCMKGDTLFTSGITSGQIAVTYTVANRTGCKAEANATIHFGRPKADFSLANGCSGTIFKPSNNATGAASYSWLVNGKPAGSGENPELSLSSGPQRISLIALAGACSDTITKEITVTTPPPAISFVPSETKGCSPLRVAFQVAGAAAPGVDYTWDVGGTADYTGFQLPAQVLENREKADQTYRISVTARNACGEQTHTREIVVRPLARAEIGVDSTMLRCTPATLLFSNRSSGHDKNLSRWLFGDGTILQSGSDTVSHLFSARDSARTYTVQLEITSACGRDTAKVPIRVYPTTVKALYTISKSMVCPGEVVRFTDATVPKPERWLWKFGDGTISTQANPAHTFANAKRDYKVTLIAYTACGSDSTQLTVKTTEAPAGAFESNALACEGSPIQLINKTDPQLGFSWDFGDGSPADSINYAPEHLYASAGTYTVTLSVYRGSQACRVIAQKAPVTVVAPAKASFSFGGDSLFCAPGPVNIVNLSEQADSYHWYFSDGRTANVKNPSLAFEPGSYGVKLVTVKGGVCMDSTERMAAFVVTHCQIDIPQAFTPNGDGIGDRYTLFGDGITQINLLRIRNRWGEVVFEMKNVPPGSQQPDESWDGTFAGKEAAADMYVYEAEVLYIDQKKSKKLRGNIYLAR